VLVIGQRLVSAALSMVALKPDGKTLWTLDLPGGGESGTCDSLAVTNDGNWAAAGIRGGQICVIDVARGRIVAQSPGQGMTPVAAWAEGADGTPPLLLVATGSEVNAFRVKPVETESQKREP
jgi:hypothetical protein